MALVCGNTFLVKPSEQDPGATMLLMEMAKEAGVPDGVVNVIHGQKEGERCTHMYVHPVHIAISYLLIHTREHAHVAGMRPVMFCGWISICAMHMYIHP